MCTLHTDYAILSSKIKFTMKLLSLSISISNFLANVRMQRSIMSGYKQPTDISVMSVKAVWCPSGSFDYT